MPDTLDARLRDITDALADLRQQLAAEISTYPTPISGCDAQFNHLLDLRHRIRAAEAALRHEVHIPSPRWPAPRMPVARV